MAKENDDIEAQRPIPLRRAVNEFPVSSQTGRSLHVSVLYRYISRGVLAADGVRVFLRAKKTGSSLCLTLADIADFLAATSGDASLTDKNTTPSRARVSNRRQRCMARDVEKELDQAGF